MATTVGVIGLGYVGLPLAVAFADAGCEVVAIDLDPAKLEAIAAGHSYIEDVPSEQLRAVAARIHASASYADLASAEAVLVCVPTPLTPNREPDLGPLLDCCRALAEVLVRDQLVVLESTTYPGTTRERVAPLLRGVGPRRRARLPPRVLTRARGSRAHRLHPAHHPQGDRRADRGLRASARSGCTGWSATRSCASPPPRPPS